jgi:hypothetical protein
VNLEGFPLYTVHPDRELYRIHRATHGPLYFSAAAGPDEGGRFGLPAQSGWGTCYFSASVMGACVETFGRFRVVPAELVDARRLTVAVPVVSLRLADLTDRRVLGRFGIAGEVSTGSDYVAARRWSYLLGDAGFDGIYYAARHDPQFTERSVAVFGQRGDRTADERKRFECTTAPLPSDALIDLADHFGITVLPSTDLFPGPADHV